MFPSLTDFKAYFYSNIYVYFLYVLKMANFSKLCHKELPFHGSSNYEIIKLFQSEKDLLFERLANNNFSKNMLKHVNGFSKNNYTCGYFQEKSIQNLLKKHVPIA